MQRFYSIIISEKGGYMQTKSIALRIDTELLEHLEARAEKEPSDAVEHDYFDPA